MEFVILHFNQLPEQQLPSPNWGWTKQNNIWVPKLGLDKAEQHMGS